MGCSLSASTSPNTTQQNINFPTTLLPSPKDGFNRTSFRTPSIRSTVTTNKTNDSEGAQNNLLIDLADDRPSSPPNHRFSANSPLASPTSIHRSSLNTRTSVESQDSNLERPSIRSVPRSNSLKARFVSSPPTSDESTTSTPKPVKQGSLRFRKSWSKDKKLAANKLEDFFSIFEHEEKDFMFAMTHAVADDDSPLEPTNTDWSSIRGCKLLEDGEDQAVSEAARDIAASLSVATTSPKHVSSTPQLDKSSSLRSNAKWSGKMIKRAGQSIFKGRSHSFVANAALQAQRPIEMTETMILLQRLVVDVLSRRRLIQELLALQGNYTVQIRFISCVCQYEDTEDLAERKRLGEKLVSIFVKDREGRFAIALREETIKYLVDGYLNFLSYARREVLEDLSQNEPVMLIVQSVDAAETQHRTLMKTLSRAAMTSPEKKRSVLVGQQTILEVAAAVVVPVSPAAPAILKLDVDQEVEDDVAGDEY